MEVSREIIKEWVVCTFDSIRKSRGFLSAWNPRSLNVNPFFTYVGFMLEGFSKDMNRHLKLINCYIPYAKRKNFCDFIKVNGLLQ